MYAVQILRERRRHHGTVPHLPCDFGHVVARNSGTPEAEVGYTAAGSAEDDTVKKAVFFIAVPLVQMRHVRHPGLQVTPIIAVHLCAVDPNGVRIVPPSRSSVRKPHQSW